MGAAIGLACLVIGIAGCGDAELQRVEGAVRATLTDPGSAQFRSIKRCASDRSIWMGEVNSKNQLGGYPGFQPFYVSERGVSYAGDNAFSEDMSRCHGAEAAAST